LVEGGYEERNVHALVKRLGAPDSDAFTTAKYNLVLDNSK
jgi:hypothetical protein